MKSTPKIKGKCDRNGTNVIFASSANLGRWVWGWLALLHPSIRHTKKRYQVDGSEHLVCDIVSVKRIQSANFHGGTRYKQGAVSFIENFNYGESCFNIEKCILINSARATTITKHACRCTGLNRD